MLTYKRPPTIDEIERNKTLYDAEIMYANTLIGDFFSFLKSEGLYNNALVIIIGSHGDEFYDHGGWEHSHSMYEELLRVPIIIKYPSKAQSGIDDKRLARIIDITPTILLDVLGVDERYFSFDGIPFSKPLPDVFLSARGKRLSMGSGFLHSDRAI